MPELGNQPATIWYPNMQLDGSNPLRVERIVGPNRALDVAADIQGLLRDSYKQIFSQGKEPAVPAEVIERHFNPDDPVMVGDQAQRITKWTEEQQSQYWVASVPQAENRDVVGFLKITPSRQRLLVKRENMYMNDIAVRPDMQGRSVDLALLRSAIRFGGYDEDARLVTDSFIEDVQLNKYLVNDAGMIPTGHALPFQLGEHSLPQRRLIMRRALTVGKFVARMERNHPELVSVA